MKKVFLISKWDKENLEEYLANNCIYDYIVICDQKVENDIFDQLIICMSEASSDSSLFQGVVLDTLHGADKSKLKRLRFDDVQVPVGFGYLCEIEDWKAE